MGIFNILNKLLSRYSATLEINFLSSISKVDLSSLYIDLLLHDFNSAEGFMFLPILSPESFDVSALRTRLLQESGLPSYIKYFRSEADGKYYIVGGENLKEEYDTYQKRNFRAYTLQLVFSLLFGYLLSAGLFYFSTRFLFDSEDTVSRLILLCFYAFICTVVSIYFVSVVTYYLLHLFGVFDRSVVEFICLKEWNESRSKVFPRKLRKV